MSREFDERGMGTADLAAAGQAQQMHAGQAQAHPPQDLHPGQPAPAHPAQGQMPQPGMPQSGMPKPMEHAQNDPQAQHGAVAGREHLAALFPPEMAQDFRARWDAVQIGFVDDPRGSVQRADELVAQVMKRLAERFASQRAAIESDLGHDERASTENMRMALRSYRSFFDRLLSL